MTTTSRMAGGFRSGGRNRIVTTGHELRIQQENIDNIMIKRKQSEQRTGSRQSQIDTHQSSNAHHRRLMT
jgi:hypothetical protein